MTHDMPAQLFPLCVRQCATPGEDLSEWHDDTRAMQRLVPIDSTELCRGTNGGLVARERRGDASSSAAAHRALEAAECGPRRTKKQRLHHQSRWSRHGRVLQR